MDYTHLGLLAATITSYKSGLDYKEGPTQRTFDGKAVLTWLLQNWPGITTQAEAVSLAQVLVTKAVLNNVNNENDRQFNEKNNYTFGVNNSGDVLVEHDTIEHTSEELVALVQNHAKKQMTGEQAVTWLVKDLNVSRKHAQRVCTRLLHLGLFTYHGTPPAPEEFQPTDQVNYTISGHVTHLPTPEDISKVYELEHVPAIIANDCKMDGVRLVYKGYLVAKYSRSPLLIVSHVTEDSVSICAPASSTAPAPHPHASVSVAHAAHAPIAHWVSHKSNVFALFTNGALQGVDVESKQAQDYPVTTQALAAQVIGLLADDAMVIGLISNGLIVWERSGSRPPRLVNLSIQVSVPLAADLCSVLPENQILLVYTGQTSAADPVFTLWNIRDLAAPKVHLLIKGTVQEPYGRVTCVAHHKDRLVFSGDKSKLMCWIRPSIEDNSPTSPTSSQPPPPTSHAPAHHPTPILTPFFVKTEPKNARTTTLFIDNWFLLVGDSTGQVSLHSRKTGERIYALNVACANAVNKIVRVGRWIFCAYDTKLAVYDIYRNDHPAPIQLYTSSAALPIRDFQVNPGAITLLLGGPALKSSVASTALQFVSSSLRTSNQSIGFSASANVSRAGRTKVAVWAPRLDALDVYLKKPSLAQSHPILPALIYTYRRIVDILVKCVHEDVAEYRATLEWMRLTIDWILKSSHDRREDVKKIDVMGIGGVPFLVLRALQLAGDKYCAELVRVCPPGHDPKQVFSRWLSSSRRRAELDRLNAAMYSALSEAVSAVGSGWQHINTNEPPFIDDTEGCAMWKAGFGASCLMAEWSRFFDILRVHQSPTAPYDAAQEAILRYILDPSGTQHVSQHRFGAFLRGFGPLTQCISKTLLITNPTWFVGYLSRVEGEVLLQTQVPGTFMIRLSRSAHAFTISVMHSDGKVHHIVVDPRPTPPSSPSDFTSPQVSPTGAVPLPSPTNIVPTTSRPRVFTVLEAVGPERYFGSLVELIQNYPHALRMPYNDPLHSMPWFQGDITSEEATHMLAHSEPGTFLIHLSNNASHNPPLSPGSHTAFKLTAGGFSPLMVYWTCSIMGTDHTVHHLVIIQHVEGFSLGTHTSVFPTLPALVKHYAPYGLVEAVATSCNTIPRAETKEKVKGERNERNAVSMHISSSQTELLKKSGSTPSIPTSVTNANQPASPGNSARASYIQQQPTQTIHPAPLDYVPSSSPFPFANKSTDTPQTNAADDIEGAVARVKAAITTLRQVVAPAAEHYRLIVLAQILLYSQRQLKSTTLLPAFKPPSSTVYEATLTPKQMDADRNVLLLSFPHLEYLLDFQARESQNDPALFLGKIENIMEAIAIFDTRRKPVIGHMKLPRS